MKKKDLCDALSGINKEYLSESDDFKAVSADFRKQKHFKKMAITSTLCLAFVGVGAIGITQSGLLNRKIQTLDEEISTVSSAESTPIATAATTESTPMAIDATTNAAVITAEQQSVTDTPRSGAPTLYSKLVRNTEIPELDGYDTSASLDIDAFEESMLNDSIGVIEGEILDIYVNHYEYETASDKFEANGRLYHKPQTVAYKIKVDRVLSGDFSIGDVVTVEDYYFVLDSVVSIKKGETYVIPIGEGDGKFYDHDEIISGDTSLESCYFTLYQFHPQIEKVDGGYIVPSDWKTLITEDCSEIIMDIDINGSPFSDSLYYVPDSVFNERIDLIIHS